MATGKVETGPGTYDVSIDGVPSTVTVPTLTAGTIAEVAPEEGDTLTVTGSNASASAEYQWQIDNVDSGGATSASLDTTGLGAGEYRRGVSDGTQSILYTPAVTVTSAAVSGKMTFLGLAEPDTTVGNVHTWSNVPLGTGRIWVGVVALQSDAVFGSGPIQIDGTNATFIQNDSSGNALTLWYRRDVTSATGDIVVDRGAAYDKGIAISWWRSDTAYINSAGGGWKGGSSSTNSSVLAGDHCVAMGSGYTTTTAGMTLDSLTGLTQVGTTINTLSAVSGESAAIWAGEHVVLSDETRTFGSTLTPLPENNVNRMLAIR